MKQNIPDLRIKLGSLPHGNYTWATHRAHHHPICATGLLCVNFLKHTLHAYSCESLVETLNPGIEQPQIEVWVQCGLNIQSLLNSLYGKISLKQLLMCANVLCIFVTASMNCVSGGRGKEGNMGKLCPLLYPLTTNTLLRSVDLSQKTNLLFVLIFLKL